MNFSWIKNIFKKKTNKNNNIITIDTTLTYIREFKELKHQEKKKVLEYFNSINLDNYKDLVKYSDDLSNLYILEQDVLGHTIDRYNKDFEDAAEIVNRSKAHISDAMAKIKVSTKLAQYEYSLIVNNIYNIRRELEYRFIALNMFINKYDELCLSKSIDKDEKQNYLSKKESLYNEKIRIQISIKNVDNVLLMIARDINENTNLEKKYELLNQLNTTLNNNFDIIISDICLRLEIDTVLRRIQNLFNHSGLLDPFIEEIIKEILDKIENKMQKKQNKKINLHHKEDIQKIQDLKYNLKAYTNCSITEFVEYIPVEYLEDLYKIITKYMHKHEIYYYIHKNDYNIYLSEMNDIYTKFHSTPTKYWDKDYLKNKIVYYEKEIDNYFELYKDYLDQDKINKLKDAFYHLAWLYSILTEKEFLLDDERNIEIRATYKKYYEELLSKVENKYGVELNIIYYSNGKQKDRTYFLDQYMPSGATFFLDLLNGYDDYVKINYLPHTFSFNNQKELIYHYYVFEITRELGSNYKTYSQFSSEEFFPIEELFYLLKFFNIEDYNLMRSISIVRDYDDHTNDNLSNFLATLLFKKYKEQYDERIVIIPKVLSQKMDEVELVETLGNIKKEKYACFTKSANVVDAFRCYKYFQYHYKFLFVEESVFKEYNNFAKESRQEYYMASAGESININSYNKIIVVPDGTKYDKLSKYLDQELEKEDAKTKKLVS